MTLIDLFESGITNKGNRSRVGNWLFLVMMHLRHLASLPGSPLKRAQIRAGLHSVLLDGEATPRRAQSEIPRPFERRPVDCQAAAMGLVRLSFLWMRRSPDMLS